MALTTTRTRLHTHLRRALSLSSFHRLPTTTTTTPTKSLLQRNIFAYPPQPQYKQLRYIHSTNPSLAYSKTFNDIDKIDPDTILFEGCDYRHWLIVMDFGKDPQQYPPPDQMVDTYVQTCAQVLGSVEEAKKKIYACSTTTYTGFQVEVDEETSKKFDGLPGVIFVLPDSYIDPVNKEYGGDKYINGTIIPRPPPVQYGRNRRNDQRSRGSFSQRGYPADNQQGSMLGEGRGNTPQRDHYQSGGNTSPPPQQRSHNQGLPSHQGNYNQGLPSHQGNYNHGMPSHLGINNHGVPNQQGNYNPGAPTHQGNYNPGVPTHQGNYNYNPGVPTHQGDYNHGVRAHQGHYNQGYTQPHLMENFAGGDRGQDYNRQGDHGYNHSQGQMRNFRDNQGGYTLQRQAEYPGSGRNYAHVPPARGADGQTGVESFEQNGPGRYGQGPSGTCGEGTSAAYGPGNTSQLGAQRFSQGPDHYGVESTEHHNYSPSDQAGMNQKRF